MNLPQEVNLQHLRMGAVNEILELMMLDAATHLTSPINEESLVNICYKF